MVDVTMSEPALRPVVLVLASTYPRWKNDTEPGFVHALCRHLAKRFKVIAVVPDAPGADPGGEMDGVLVVRYRYAPRSLQTLVNDGGIVANLRRHFWKWLLVPGFVLAQYWAARRVVRTHSVQMVHAHWLIPQGLIALRLARSHFAVPFLVTSHGGDLFGLRSEVLQSLKRRIASASTAMTVVSRAMADEAKYIGLVPPRLAVLPMGVDLQDRFVPDCEVHRACDELLFVGRLVPKKGLRYLLAAMPEIRVRRPAVKLIIAGFGPEQGALKAQAKHLGIEDCVRFLGATTQQELPALYQRASAFVAPFIRDSSGDQEGLPVALMEAIGCGCPAIVGDVAGVRELLGDTASRTCVNPEDLSSLANAIVDVLDHPDKARAAALSMRELILRRVDWEVISSGYADLIQTCLDHVSSKTIYTEGSPS
jgi:glycosyltransferase involved in cell wall biosynthesis